MKTVILSLGGSIICPEEVDYFFLKQFKNFVLEYLEKDYRLIIFCGGGGVNSRYNQAVQRITEVRPVDLDWIGIMATRLNAELVRAMFGELAYEHVITDPTEKIDTDRPIIVGAGWKPGWSTDYDAVKIAEQLGAKDLINMTNISHVYSKDPRKFDDAERLYEIKWKDYRKIVGDKWSPRMNSPFDPIASKLAQTLKMKVAILKGTDLDNLRAYLSGDSFDGTLIH